MTRDSRSEWRVSSTNSSRRGSCRRFVFEADEETTLRSSTSFLYTNPRKEPKQYLTPNPLIAASHLFRDVARGQRRERLLLHEESENLEPPHNGHRFGLAACSETTIVRNACPAMRLCDDET